jgi:hypothetical protein
VSETSLPCSGTEMYYRSSCNIHASPQNYLSESWPVSHESIANTVAARMLRGNTRGLAK